MAEFSPTGEIRRIQPIVDEFFESVIHEFEPLFVSDEAKIWDVSTETAEQLTERLRNYYGYSVTAQELDLPLWQLLIRLDSNRKASAFRGKAQ